MTFGDKKKPGLMVAIALGKDKKGGMPDEGVDEEHEVEDDDGAALKDAAHSLATALGLNAEKLDMDDVAEALASFCDLHSEMSK